MLTDCAKNQELCPPELVQQTLELNLAQTEGVWVDMTVNVGFDPISSNAQKKNLPKMFGRPILIGEVLIEEIGCGWCKNMATHAQ